MGKWGEFDYKDYEKFAKNFSKQLKQQSAEAFLVDLLNDLGVIVLGNVKENTPVGDYGPKLVEFTTKDGKRVSFMTKGEGRTGGHLRDNWKVKAATIVGKSVELVIYNPVHYAPYVENGHRIVRNGVTVGWVEGQFMLKITLDELQEKLAYIIEPRYIAYLNKLVGG